MWEDFWGRAKNVGGRIGFKKYYNVFTKYNACGKYQGETSSVNLKMGQDKIKLIGRKCNLN